MEVSYRSALTAAVMDDPWLKWTDHTHTYTQCLPASLLQLLAPQT